MNKAEQREVDLAKKYNALGHADIAARSLSALIRATRKKDTAEALRVVADALGVTSHPEFIA